MRKLITSLTFATALAASGGATAQDASSAAKPTIVLVHGAFAESSSWDGVIARLNKDGYRVIAAANPLRGVASDAASVAAVVRSVTGPVVLVGHSYGGPVITEAANGAANVKGLVYVAGFAPDTGESSLTLSSKFPGSTLPDALAPVPFPGGGHELYIQTAKFRAQFAADVDPTQAALMAATQRPVLQAALAEPSGQAAWKRLPSYVIYGSDDRNIPAAVMKFMAERAHARKTVAIRGASHAVMVSHPDQVSALIEFAAEDVKTRQPLSATSSDVGR
jgi:pimeloyl-ACP methyl ester carboxylesterase